VNSNRAHGMSLFEAVAPAAILANSAVLGWGWIDHAHDVAAELIDTRFLVYFLVELFMRLKRGGWPILVGRLWGEIGFQFELRGALEPFLDEHGDCLTREMRSGTTAGPPPKVQCLRGR
jgi:uncharacterized membrane protein YtjA (UPF0391 family)